MIHIYLTFLLQFTSFPFEGWDTLSKLKLDKQYDDLLKEYLDVPVFSDDLRAFDGMIVEIEGYVIPLQAVAQQDYFVLSRFPYSSCFFCGNAGPETVAEVYTSEKVPFKDEKVRVKGKLRLNAEDPLHLFFIFEDAEVEKI